MPAQLADDTAARAKAVGLALTDGAAHAMVRHYGVRPEVLAERIEAWRGERNIAIARRLIGLCDPRSESPGESWLRLRIVDAGFPIPEPQIWILDGDTDRVEYDGREFHSSDEAVRHDEHRRARLAREFGWHVIGVGRGEVLSRSMALERGHGELLGMQPQIHRHIW